MPSTTPPGTAALPDTRALALVLGLVGFAASVAYEFLLRPVAWRLPAAGRWSLELAPLSLSVALLVGHVLAVRPRGRGWPAALLPAAVRGRPAFVVPAHSVWSGTAAIVLMLLAAGAVVTERSGDSVRLPRHGWIPSLVAPAVVIVLAVLVLYGCPRVALLPGGVEVRGIRTRTARWSALVPGGPPAPPPRAWRLILLLTAGADRPPERFAVPLACLAVDPAFLSAAIRHYVRDGPHRDAIGTPGEYERLLATLTAR